jgi:hypothetical protein
MLRADYGNAVKISIIELHVFVVIGKRLFPSTCAVQKDVENSRGAFRSTDVE